MDPRKVTESQKTVLLGDSAHAMIPYMSQGAAMAVEDRAALATVLSMVENREELPFALKVYESERMRRSGQMQEASLLNGKLWHFADGPEQQARDESMRPEVEGKSFSWSANQWTDPVRLSSNGGHMDMMLRQRQNELGEIRQLRRSWKHFHNSAMHVMGIWSCACEK